MDEMNATREQNTLRGPTLATKYDGVPKPGWLWSEKLDGIRATWDGTDLRTRNGNAVRVPAAWIGQLKQTAGEVKLDGELFAGRGQFLRMLSVYGRSNATAQDWAGIRFMVFDVDAPGPYRQRMATLPPILPDFVAVVPHSPVESRTDLTALLAGIVSAGGEGIMLRDPSAPYLHRRTAALQKVKPDNADEQEESQWA